MKEIIYNYDYLNDSDINNTISRAKMIVENDNEELLVVNSNNTYFLIGGHVEQDETFDECIIREIKEESGVEIPYEERKPFFSIKYYSKDYPEKGKNTKYINNYYSIKFDLVPDYDKMKLEQNEINGNFKLSYIHKDNIIDILEENLKVSPKPVVVRDTIEVIKEYLKN